MKIDQMKRNRKEGRRDERKLEEKGDRRKEEEDRSVAVLLAVSSNLAQSVYRQIICEICSVRYVKLFSEW